MEDYDKIIESLGIHYISISKRNLKVPICVTSYHDLNNTMCFLDEGEINYGEDGIALNPSDILFIPAGKSVDLEFGASSEAISHDEFSNNIGNYFNFNTEGESSYVNFTFDAKLFDAISYFSSLDIPPFVVSGNTAIPKLMKSIIEENKTENAGKERVIKNYTDLIVIELVRYILDNKLFVEQLATNTAYFKDPRLIDIFKYIKENLKGDLSNKTLADVANVSEDYVGQYFKMLTGINPQDYIEYQRMESAVYLLRTTKRSIREIGKEVGYKDTAYFCRRFKMMFGIPAGKLRRREKMS